MGENAQKVGKKLEAYSWNLFDTFGWVEKYRDKEIKCSRSSHKNANNADKRTHGVDIYLEHEDPYINKKQGVFVECKNRQWCNVNKDNIEIWLSELINTIECASMNEELQDLYDPDSDKYCGLLLINTNDDKFNKAKFHEYLRGASYKSKKIPLKIFVAGNDMFNKWWAINNINATDYNNSLKYINLSINNSRPLKSTSITISQLFSKYIFCEYVCETSDIINGKQMYYQKETAVILCFDNISRECINYLWSMCRFYQFETKYDSFDICFFPEKGADVAYVRENFKNILKQFEGGIDNSVIERINIKFLQNRDLNIVENF